MTYDPNRPLNTAATEREIDRTADKTNSTIDSAADKAKNVVDSLSNKASDLTNKANNAISSGSSSASDLKDKATQVAGDVQARASEVASQAADKADAATTTAGSKLQDAAQMLREKAPVEGTVGQAATATADTLERAGTYLQQQDISGMRSDLESIIRQHPTESLLVAFGVGFLLARSTRR